MQLTKLQSFQRTFPDFSGTVMIMGIDRTESFSHILKMIESVLRHFWLAIWREQLVVEFEDINSTGERYTASVDKENIEKLIYGFFPDPYDLKRRKDEKYNPRPYFDAVAKVGISDKYVVRTDTVPLLGELALYFNKTIGDKSVDRVVYTNSINLFVYSDITHTRHGFSAVFECRNERGRELLREIENTSHDKWDTVFYTKKKPAGVT